MISVGSLKSAGCFPSKLILHKMRSYTSSFLYPLRGLRMLKSHESPEEMTKIFERSGKILYYFINEIHNVES